MIEKIILNYLNSNKISSYMEKEKDMPKEYVIIEKTGSGGTRYIKKATIALQSYSQSLLGASALNEKVKKVMEDIIKLEDITKCELNGDYNYSNTSNKQYRYQAIFDITHY